MENPNEYNDVAFLDALAVMEQAVIKMWKAGATTDDIVQACVDAIGELDEL
jgi:hypothetical protein